MKRFHPALLAVFLLATPGCLPKNQGEGSDSGEGGYPQTTSRSPSDSSNNLNEYVSGASSLQDQVSAASAGENNDSLAQRWRATFDGDQRELNAVNAGPRGAVVSAGGASWTGGPRRKINMSRGRKNTLTSREPPSPGKTPDVDLPDATKNPEGKLAGAGPVMRVYDAFQKKIYDSAYPLISRWGWGARARRGSDEPQSPYRVTIHHTTGRQTMGEAESIAEVKNIQWYHMIGRGKEGKDNFSDVGYHFLIDGSGRVFEGRHADALGAHANNQNTGNIGVALLGDYNKHKPTQAQVDSLRRLVAFLAIQYKMDKMKDNILEGHHDVEGQQTSCPGKNLLSMIADLRQDINRETQRIADKPAAGSSDIASGKGFVPMSVVSKPS